MNLRALLVLAFIATAAGGQTAVPPPKIPQEPAATLPGASSTETDARSDTSSAKSTPPANTPPGAPIPLPPVPMSPDRADDSYAIYSQLMPGSYLLNLGPEHNQAWLVADATITRGWPGDRVASARRCIQPPADRIRDFQSVFDDFDAHKSERIQLERNFQVQIPYKLLSESRLKSFDEMRTASAPQPDPATADDFRGTPGITYFSQVYFNLDNTLALVYMLEWCGPKCGDGEWIALEKISGGWVRHHWNICSLAS